MINMKVNLIAYTPNPEKTVACAAKLCYANSGIDELYDGLTPTKSADFVEMLAAMGHESPIEHVSFTFGIEGISRSCSHQLVRHRIASYSQQSQRYVKNNELDYVIPPQIAEIPEARDLFVQTMEADLKVYNALTELLQKKHHAAMLESGVAENQAKSMAEKMAIEDARFVLPNACETKIIVTMNARSLMNFFTHRCCNRAQWEIKAVADEILRLVCGVAPTLFAAAGPGCYKKSCTEGKKSCGAAEKMRAHYKELHDLAINEAKGE